MTTVVTTTINIPLVLKKYAENAKLFGHQEVRFIVIGDRKSKSGTREFCESITRNYYPCEYLDLDDQKRYLERFPQLWTHLPFDSIQRRNIGILKAFEDGARVIVTVDDDNWILNQDFVTHHNIVGSVIELPTYESSSGWFNVCSVLEERNGIRFYHRGYPIKMRWTEENAFLSVARIRAPVAVNAGLWLDDPDVDALTRLYHQPVVVSIKEGTPDTFALHPGTWCPFNSQNTALTRETIPAYFLSPYVGRYDDIWASYVVTRIAEHLKHVVAFGKPLVWQRRNEHDLWKDFDAERNGMILTDDFCQALRAIGLRGAEFHECFGEVIEGLECLWKGSSLCASLLQWRTQFLDGLRIWHEVFQRISGF